MDIFVRNIPPNASEKQIARFFEAPLKGCGITESWVHKMRDKPMANITVADAAAGALFLQIYGVPQGAPARARAQRALTWYGKVVICIPSSKVVNSFCIRSLQHTAQQSVPAETPPALRANPTSEKTTQFKIAELQCGVWEYSRSQLVFESHYQTSTPGCIVFGQKEAKIWLGGNGSDQKRIDIKYYECDSIVLGDYSNPTITLSMTIPPRFYHVSAVDILSAQLSTMVLGSTALRPQSPKKLRIASIDDMHAKVADVCFIYRVTLAVQGMMSTVRTLLHRSTPALSVITMPTSVRTPPEAWKGGQAQLESLLTDPKLFGSKPFAIRYQLTRFARNGRLPPVKVRALLSVVDDMLKNFGSNACQYALRRFYHDVPVAGPDVEAAECSITALQKQLYQYTASYNPHLPDNPYELVNRYSHINLVHKVVVTPVGMYLEGPDPEPENRVLREYSTQTECFIRVVFQDDDGSPVRHDPRASNELIFHKRFKDLMDHTINIVGYGYSFLGFSHSSLRSRSCWFMAPVIDKTKSLRLAPHIIQQLGDFSHIRIPAKCAARIGQCFTDTVASVSIKSSELGSLPVVERNGRDFSDGVGTISREILEDVWLVYGSKRLLRPTALQIRFQGAKGMVSLDSRLTGRQLLLRSNMEKFHGSESKTLEICGAAFRPLPMVLNRQFIKIFEDLGVSVNAFMELQDEAIQRLTCMLHSAANAASLLEVLEMTKATKLPSLLLLLDEVGVDFRTDAFLFGIAELGVIHQLRDIKHRGRIPVSQGVTLYGIMDETGYLREGQIYVVMESGPGGGRREHIQHGVVITRSPAMHPGDIQVVDAVDVPSSSPLKQLRNVVVFSQHGDRDLPSKLSGGDLDGDLYNVIWDERLRPRRISTPADYPNVKPMELDRAVTAKDMTDFFVTFMETDALGMLCTTHMQLADQRSMGTFDPDCIKLAEMASTAVDYSKTGIPINLSDVPRHDRFRPDFMAPSPRVIMSSNGYMDLEDDDPRFNDEAFEGLDDELPPFGYYRSDKALGHLYRAIDERNLINVMQKQHQALTSRAHASASLLRVILSYMLKWCGEYGIHFEHHIQMAQYIRADYEEHLTHIMHHYSPVTSAVLSEQEVFAGCILGRRGGAQGKPLRELSKTMRERFDAVVEYMTARIVKGDQAVHEAEDLGDVLYDEIEEREFEALPRAIACLQVAVQERGLVDRKAGEVKSFAYVAAGVCLRELKRYRITTFGSRVLPRVHG